MVSDGTTHSNKEIQNWSLIEQKQSLKDEFEKLSFKIIIVIDDLDRLTSEEIVDFFRAIKAMIDFPNILFILAYDEEVVRNAVGRIICKENNGKFDSDCARKYLEKIVQISIPLPPPNEIKMKIFLWQGISELLKNTHEVYIEQEHWEYIDNSVFHFVSTPRKIKRFINTIQILYPSIENEVNGYDFICLETIRQFLPEIYSLIINNPDYFLYKPADDSFSLGINTTEHKRFHEKWFEEIKNQDKKFALTILLNLFPNVSVSIPYHGIILKYEKSGKIKSARIHANKAIFRRYFRLEIDNSDYSINAINSLFETSFNSKTFSQLLEENSRNIDDLTKISKSGLFLKQLENYIGDYNLIITQNQIKAILSSFFNIADKLLIKSDLHQGAHGNFGNSRIIERISIVLIERMDQLSRGPFLKNQFKNGHSISLIAMIIGDLENSNNPERVMNSLICEEELSELKEIFIKRLEKWTQIGSKEAKYDFSIFKKPEIGFLIYMWKTFQPDNQKLSNFIQKFVNDNDAFTSAIIESSIYEGGLSIHTLQKYISRWEQKQRILKILTNKSDLIPYHKKILENFIEYDETPN